MKLIAFILMISFVGCEHDNIVACQFACKETGMQSYSQDKGCICFPKDK